MLNLLKGPKMKLGWKVLGSWLEGIQLEGEGSTLIRQWDADPAHMGPHPLLPLVAVEAPCKAPTRRPPHAASGMCS